MDWKGHVEIRIGKTWHNYMPVFFARTDIVKKLEKSRKKSLPDDISKVTALFLEYDSDNADNQSWINEKDLYELADSRQNAMDWNSQDVFDLLYMKEEIGFDEARLILWQNP